MPRQGAPVPSRYQPLIEYLAASATAEVVLTFAQIEEILGVSLPTSAYGQGTYWSGMHYAHVRALRAAGWLGRIDPRNGRVHFTRSEE